MVATPQSPERIVHLDVLGPVYHRCCFEESRKFLLVEEPTPGGLIGTKAYEGGIRLSNVSHTIRESFPEIVLPEFDRLQTEGILHFNVIGNKFLHGAIVDCNFPNDIFESLGNTLARFHALHLGQGFPDKLVVNPLLYLSADRSSTLHTALTLQVELLQRARRAELVSAPATLLHGRWSSGSIIIKGSNWIILSGVEQWYGPGEHDVGYLVGELVEQIAEDAIQGHPRDAVHALNAVVRFVRHYGQHRSLDIKLLMDWVAHRIVSHLILNTMWRGQVCHPQPNVKDWHLTIAALWAALLVVEQKL